MSVSKIYCILLLCVVIVHGKKFPSYISKCHRSDPNLKQCFREAVKKIQPYLMDGVPEFRLPKMNPLVITEVSLDSGDSFKARFHNVQIFKAYDYHIDDIDIDLDENRLKFDFYYPILRITSEYHVQGKMLFMVLNGTGPADGNLTDVHVSGVFSGKRYIKDGQEYINFNTMDVDEKIGKPVFRFSNLFRNNPELTEQTNKVVNENIQDVIQELKPVINAAINSTALEFVGRVFSKYSVDELFPK